MNCLDMVRSYDLVLIIDVIEHLSRSDGLALLEAVQGNYIVTTPAYWSKQGTCFGNKHETHISQWTPHDFFQSKILTDRLGREHIMGWK
jgi:hypothetical protein